MKFSITENKLNLDISLNGGGLSLDYSDSSKDLNEDSEAQVKVYETDYNKLKNKPKLDGIEIIGDMHEKDPTVPGWAKAESKPSYNAEEVGAVDADDSIPLDEIDTLFNGLFD